jgi:hypothetical protein
MVTRASFSVPARAAGPLFLGALLLAACDFDVNNPGRVLDKDLNAESSVKPLVTGMSSDFSEEYDGIAFLIARASDEMAGSGSYSDTRLYRVGDISYDYVDGVWEGISRARWVAEDGLRRMATIEGYEFDGNVLTARAYLYAGLSNRVLGESFCHPVYDGGGPLEPSAAFQRAVDHFNEAIDHGVQAGADEVVTAANGGLAQAYVGLGEWTNAVSAAGLVPTDFVFNALYHTTSGREENEIYIETHRRPEMSAYNTYVASLDPPDPRTPYTDCSLPEADCGHQQGADGSTPHLQQERFTAYGDDIPAVKGTEMRLIEAEARLVQASDVPGAIARINDVRDFFSLDPIDPTGMTLQDAWITLDHERMLTLWLEGRRFADQRRWQAAGLDFLPAVQFIFGGTIVYPGDNPRDICIPISRSECLVNTNVKDTSACGQ